MFLRLILCVCVVCVCFCVSRFLVYLAFLRFILHVGSKFGVQRPCCAARSAAKKMESNFAARIARRRIF